MSTLSMSRSPQGEEGRAFSRKLMGLRILVLIGLGAMGLMIVSLLPGCGSDSNTGGSVSGKNEKTVKSSKTPKPQSVLPLLTDKEGIVRGERGKIKQKSELQHLQAFPGAGVTMEQVRAKMAEDQKTFDPRVVEAFPGSRMTQEQLRAKMAEDRKTLDPKLMETLPNVNQVKPNLRPRGKP
jgi:hypothetical protein